MQQTAMTNAFNSFVNDPCVDDFPGLEACLRAKWATIEIDCPDSGCDGLDGFQSGNKISMCVTSGNRLGPVLLHELVHACGGTELDSEAVEWKCFAGNGATAPYKDWDKFKDETSSFGGDENVRVGKYVIWDSETGEVWAKDAEGGKGDRQFQSDDWKHDYPSGGGGWI